MCERLQDAVLPVIETLEGRVLLSASVDGTTLTVDGNATSPNKINVSYIHKTHSIRVVENRVRQDFPVAELTGIQITGGSSRDVITIAGGVALPTTINGMGGNDQITGNAENDTIITGQGSSVIHPGLGTNSIDLTLGSNRVVLTRKAVDTIIATTQDKVIGATSSTQIVAPSTPAGAPVPTSPPAPPAPPVPPLPPAPSGPPELIPGTGFTGPTTQPTTVGSGAGSDAESIAQWDVVPYQTFSGTFNVGIVAFHINGIDHVDFSVNGGAWAHVYTPTLNPQTNVTEYTAELNAADFPTDGQIQVRAIAYPTSGLPRLLPSLFLNSNANGTLTTAPVWVSSTTGNDSTGNGTQANPYASMLAAAILAPPGATVYLEAGSYPVYQRGTGYRNGQNQWINFEAAPGVSQSDVNVVVSAANSMRADKLALHNVSLDLSAGFPLTNDASGGAGNVWLDNVNVFGSLNIAATISQIQPNFAGNIFITGSKVHDMSYTPLDGVALMRNCQIYDCYAHGVDDPLLMINTTIDNIQPRPGIDDHVDGIFWYDPNNDENSIVYNVTLTNIAGLTIFSDQPGQNIAIENVSATASGVGVGGSVQFGKGLYSTAEKHILINNLNLPNQRFVWVDQTTNNSWSDCIIENSVADGIFSQNTANEIINCAMPDGTPIPNQY